MVLPAHAVCYGQPAVLQPRSHAPRVALRGHPKISPAQPTPQLAAASLVRRRASAALSPGGIQVASAKILVLGCRVSMSVLAEGDGLSRPAAVGTLRHAPFQARALSPCARDAGGMGSGSNLGMHQHDHRHHQQQRMRHKHADSIAVEPRILGTGAAAGSLADAQGSRSAGSLRARAGTADGLAGDSVAAAESKTETARGAEGAAAERTVLLLDVMDTLVLDPFHVHIPGFFGLSMKELLQQKHPTAWIDFEKGHISEEELQKIFFLDGRDFDMQGLKVVMSDAYQWLDGVEELLQRLKHLDVEMHAFTNYPCWYSMIEEKLQLSRYVQWTFVSCHMGQRKPDPASFTRAARELGVRPEQCIFVDDRQPNVAAAKSVGMNGLLFTSAQQLVSDLTPLLKLPLQ